QDKGGRGQMGGMVGMGEAAFGQPFNGAVRFKDLGGLLRYSVLDICPTQSVWELLFNSPKD
ncbi:MAG: hypothetical protein ACFNUE_04220, partial [Bacteroides sp.]